LHLSEHQNSLSEYKKKKEINKQAIYVRLEFFITCETTYSILSELNMKWPFVDLYHRLDGVIFRISSSVISLGS